MTSDSADRERRCQNRELIERYFEGIGEQDLDAVQAVCAEDFVLEMPYADPPLRLEGFAAFRDYVTPALETLVFTLTITRVHECLDPDLLVVEYTSQGTAKPTGRPYGNVYIGVWRCRDGRVVEGREYYNPDATRKALTVD